MLEIEASGGTVHWLDRGAVRLRAASWPGAGSGTVLLLHGRTECIEKYIETVAMLRDRGFAVWTLDWRGQGRSSRLLPDALPNHVGSFEDHLADLEHLIASMPGREAPFVVLGQSMGGHLALRLMARSPGLFERAVLVAPMVDFPRPGGMPLWVARALSVAVCAVPGIARRFGPGTARMPDRNRAFAGNALTSCPKRFAHDLALLDQPGLIVGGATWGWLQAALRSIAVMRSAGFAPRVTTQVLLILAGADRVVDNVAARRLAARLPAARLLEIPGAQHELLREDDAVQQPLWAAFDAFVDQPGWPTNPAAPMPAIAASSSLSDVSPDTPTAPNSAPAASLTSTPPATGISAPPATWLTAATK